MYGDLLINDAVKIDYIGSAHSALIDGKKSVNIAIQKLKKNPYKQKIYSHNKKQ